MAATVRSVLLLLLLCEPAAAPEVSGPSRCIDAFAKLSDEQINSVGAAKLFRFVVTPAREQRTASYYMHTQRPFDDEADGMGLLPLRFVSVATETANQAAASPPPRGCNTARRGRVGVNSSCAFATRDCSVLRHWFMYGEHGGLDRMRSRRCFSAGLECGGGMIRETELWVRSRERPGAAREEYPFSCINAPRAALEARNVTLTLRPRGPRGAPPRTFSAVCDAEGFMKVLQTHSQWCYAPTANAVNASALRQTPCQSSEGEGEGEGAQPAGAGGEGEGDGDEGKLMHHPDLGSSCDRCEGKEVWAYGTAAMVSLITFCCVFSVALVVEQRWSIHSELLAVGALCVFVFGFVCLSFFWACVDQSDTQERYFYPSLLFVGICGLSTAVLPLRNFKANRRQHMFDRRYIALHVYLLLSTVRKEQKKNGKQTDGPPFLPPCLFVCV